METLIWLIALCLVLLVGWLMRCLVKAARSANRTDWGGSWTNLIDGLNRLYCYRYHRLNILGLRLPASGPAIVVANHVSGLDPLLLIASARRPLRFIIAREEYERFGLTWLFDAGGCIPVDRERNPEKALRAALRALNEGEVIALFPHGKIHLDSEPPRRIKAGAVRLAEMTRAPIIPLRIEGVGSPGTVFRSLLRRSRAKVRAYHRLDVDGLSHRELMEQLQEILDGNAG